MTDRTCKNCRYMHKRYTTDYGVECGYCSNPRLTYDDNKEPFVWDGLDCAYFSPRGEFKQKDKEE